MVKIAILLVSIVAKKFQFSLSYRLLLATVAMTTCASIIKTYTRIN